MNHTILVVEDEKELREMMREALELNGYTVVTAIEGQAALDALAPSDPPCLVLLDLLMPGMNGWDFFREMRARPGLSEVPVVRALLRSRRCAARCDPRGDQADGAGAAPRDRAPVLHQVGEGAAQRSRQIG